MLRRYRISQALGICLLLVAPLAPAQESTDRAKQCVPAAHESAGGQRLSTEILGTLVPGEGFENVPAMYLATLLQEIQVVLEPPDTITTLSSGQIGMWLHADGRLTSPRAIDTLLPPELVRALSEAVDSTSRLGGIGPVPPLGSDSVPLRLVVYFASLRTPLSVPLFRVRVPRPYLEFEVEKPALARRGNLAPKYPDGLRQTRTEGEVLAQFVVNEDGRADMRSFRALKASHVDFVIAVREALPHMRFSPAEIAGCPVRQLVQLPFAFKFNW